MRSDEIPVEEHWGVIRGGVWILSFYPGGVEQIPQISTGWKRGGGVRCAYFWTVVMPHPRQESLIVHVRSKHVGIVQMIYAPHTVQLS